jgi:hypothetical protein
MRPRIALAPVAFVLLGIWLMLAACSPASSKGPQSEPARAPAQSSANDVARGRTESAQRAPAPAGASAGAPAESGTNSAAADAPLPRLDRMIVANLGLTLAVDDVMTAAHAVEGVANRYGGFVSNSNVRNQEKVREGTMAVRVPFPRLSEALTDLRGLAKRVTEETRSTEDITEEFTDVESNLRNLRATETQLIGLMEKATRSEDILRIQRELTTNRGQIEKIEGRRRMMENRSDLATISVKIIEAPAQAPRDGWNAVAIFAQALGTLRVIGQELATVLIWLLIFSPLYVIPAIAIRWYLRNRPPRPSAPPPAPLTT